MDRSDLGLAIEDAGLSPEVLLIKVSRQIMKNNNYLIVDPVSRQSVIVDPAWEMEKIQAAVADSESKLSGILITHTHFDHIDLAKPMADFYRCPIWMSRQAIQTSRVEARQLVAIDEQAWQVGAMRIQPILTPGHTPGCTCYLIGKNVFSGDVLFAEGCGLCKSESAAHQMFDSLERLKTQLEPDTRIFPGHTYMRPPGQTYSEVLSSNMYLHFRDKESFAAFRLRKGQSERKLFDFI